MMKRGIKILSGCLCGLLLSAGGLRAINDVANPYRAITDRNVFSLLPPEPPAPVAPPTPPANIKLTGITTMFGPPRALLMVQDTKPGGQEKSCMLTEGQREGDVEVLEINEREGAVKVKNAGVEATLTFEKDGIKLAAAPLVPSVPVPAVPGVPPPIAPAAAAPAPAPTALTPPGGLRQIPSRQLRVSENASSPGASPSASLNPGFNAGQNSSPFQGSKQMKQNTGQQSQTTAHQLSPDEQRAMLIIQNEMHKDDPSWPKFNMPED